MFDDLRQRIEELKKARPNAKDYNSQFCRACLLFLTFRFFN